MWKASNFLNSLTPLRITYAIIGHGVFHYPTGRRRFVFSVIYATIITTLSIVTTGFTFDYCLRASWYGPTEKIFFLVLSVNTAIAYLSQILSWYHERTSSRLAVRLSRIDETLKELQASFEYNRIFKFGVAYIALSLVIILSFNAIAVLWLLNVMPIYQILAIVTVLQHPVHINSIVAFNFSILVRLLEYRFCKTNEILEDIATHFGNSINNRTEKCAKNKISATTITLSLRQILNTPSRKDVIQIIKQVHLELCLLAKELNQVYGVQITLDITASFVTITGFFYDAYFVILDPPSERRNLRLIVLIIWSIGFFIKFMVVNQACENVTAEAERAGNIIYCLQESIRDAELADEINQFSLQIAHQSLAFQPAGFFTLGFKFVLGFVGSVTTYLVILIQMNPTNEVLISIDI